MLDAIIQEALHSHQFETLTNNELVGIMEIIQHAKDDLDNNSGNRAKDAYEVKVAVMFSYNGENKKW